MKKTIGVMMALVLLFAQLIPVAYATSDVSSASTFESVVQTATQNPYEKIHIYTHADDSTDYSSIRNAEELSTAIQGLKSFVNTNNTQTTVQSDIVMTVEFTSHITETNEYVLFRDQIQNAKSVTQMRESRKVFNEFSKKYHTDLINEQLPLLKNIEYFDIDIVGYSPFVILDVSPTNLTDNQLTTLANNDSVTNISLETQLPVDNTNFYTNSSVDSLVTSVNTTESDIFSWDEMLDSIGAGDIVRQGTYQGEFIYIGVLESGICDVTNLNLIGKDITIIPSSAAISDHATNVTSIISLMAPAATIFCDIRSERRLSLENLLDNNCDVVNLSQNEVINVPYSPMYDGVMDYQVSTHYVTVVKSAGNLGDRENNNYVSAPGQGYNVITVGGVKPSNNGTIVYNGDASYNKLGYHIKPNLCGITGYVLPNDANGNGATCTMTSYSAPQVTAGIALLIEAYFLDKQIMLLPDTIMALLMSGTETPDDYQPISLGLIHLDRRTGAGVFNLANCIDNETVVSETFVNNAQQYDIVYQIQVVLVLTRY